ncbi:MAG: hypothetical protein LBV56_06165 [Delftia acidovorans]|jgi:hypothetical protein|nr:hypothetical protein [Delftia acidovorans]
MNNNRPPNIHPHLARFTCDGERAHHQVLTNRVSTVTPGVITATSDGYGGIHVHQTLHETVSHQAAGTIARHYASFVSDDGRSVELEVTASGTYDPTLYLWLDQEFWIFQTASMPEPCVIMGNVPGIALDAPHYPSMHKGMPLSSDAARQNIQTALFDFRAFFQRIGKGSPRSLLGSDRLQNVMAAAKAESAQRHGNTAWPSAQAGPVDRFLPVAVTAPNAFAPRQTVGGQINTRWLGLGIALGLGVYFLLGNTITHAVLRATGTSSVFFMTSAGGLLVQLALYVGLSLAVLMLFMKPLVKKPFVFDEDAFFETINAPYHPEAKVGLVMNDLPRSFGKKTEAFNAAELADHMRLRAHEKCDFRFRSHEELVRMLPATKLSDQEAAALLAEIAAVKLPLSSKTPCQPSIAN